MGGIVAGYVIARARTRVFSVEKMFGIVSFLS